MHQTTGNIVSEHVHDSMGISLRAGSESVSQWKVKRTTPPKWNPQLLTNGRCFRSRNPQRQRLLDRRGAIRSGEVYLGSKDISFELAHQREQDVLPGALEEAADAGEDLKRKRQSKPSVLLMNLVMK
jgi:hypothetical protein